MNEEAKMEATTQRIELAKQIAAIFEDRDLDFDQACILAVGLIQGTTAGAPLLPEFASREEYDFSGGVRGKYVEKETEPRSAQKILQGMKEIVPIESLAPACLENPSGKHCAAHRYRVTGLLHELRCCWCKETVEVRITTSMALVEGHGPSSGYEEDRFVMPEGWEEGP